MLLSRKIEENKCRLATLPFLREIGRAMARTTAQMVITDAMAMIIGY
jgi:hypothetical protein